MLLHPLNINIPLYKVTQLHQSHLQLFEERAPLFGLQIALEILVAASTYMCLGPSPTRAGRHLLLVDHNLDRMSQMCSCAKYTSTCTCL